MAVVLRREMVTELTAGIIAGEWPVCRRRRPRISGPLGSRGNLKRIQGTRVPTDAAQGYLRDWRRNCKLVACAVLDENGKGSGD